MMNKFNNYLDNIISEASEIKMDLDTLNKEYGTKDEAPKSNPASSSLPEIVMKNFCWKNNRYLRQVKNEELRKSIAEKTVDVMIQDFKDNIGKELTWYSPSNAEYTGKILEVNESTGKLKFEGPGNWNPDKKEEREWGLGLLMTEKALDFFFDQLKEPFEQNKKEKEKAAEEARKAKEAKKQTYASEEVQQIIKKFKDPWVQYCYSTGYPKFPAEVEDEFKTLDDKTKTALINYYEDYVFSNPNIEYYDGSDYFKEKDRLSEANRKNRDFVLKLKEIK